VHRSKLPHLRVLLGTDFQDKTHAIVDFINHQFSFYTESGMVTCDRIEFPLVTKYFTVKNSNNLQDDSHAGLTAISANVAENYSSHYQAFSSKDESFGPREERFVEFYVHPHNIQTTNHLIAKSLYLQPSLVILDTVFDPNDHLQVLVINNSDDFVFLP